MSFYKYEVVDDTGNYYLRARTEIECLVYIKCWEKRLGYSLPLSVKEIDDESE